MIHQATFISPLPAKKRKIVVELLSLSLSIGRILKNRDKHQFKFQITTSFHLANQEKFRVGKIQINTSK